jgi:serine/threonine protein kinase
MEKLGSGAFGRVVRVRKRTTQRHYAMKGQHKEALVHHYKDVPTRLLSEKAALAASSYPFKLHMVSSTSFAAADAAAVLLHTQRAVQSVAVPIHHM